MKTKLFTLLLTVAASVGTMFAYDAKIGNLFYNLNTTNLTAEVTEPDVSWGDAYRNGTTTVSIPENITYNSKTYKVTSIGNSAFYGCQKLTSITIPSSITRIGKNAFWNCYVLTSVTIPSSVTSIQRGAFGYCKALTSVNIPNRVTSIEENVFFYCSSLTSITIPNSVTSIGSSAFQNCTGLTSVHISDIAAWCAISFGDNPLYYAHNLYLNGELIKNLVIPNSVTSIGESAFSGCSGLTSVTFPNSVPSIGDGAFSGCSGLTSVTIPNSVTSIGDGAFSGCSNLTSVTIPSSVTSIGGNAFSSCSKLKTVTLGSNAIVSKPYSSSSNIKNIFGTQVTNYIIGSGVTSIGSYAFNGCSNLTSVTIPSSVTSIGGNAFSSCSKLKTVTLGSNAIVSKTYSSSSNIKNIFGTQVTNYIIGSGVTSIGSYAFDGCTKLTSVTIPNSVTSIGVSMFSRCSDLTSINVASNNPNYCSINGVLFNKDVTVLFQCPGGKSGTYNIPNSITNIKEGSFSGCSKLTSIAIPNSVTSIGSYAFNNCSSLTSATIGNSVTSIGAYAFYACSKLTKIVIPNSVINLGTNAFESCSGLVSAEIGTGITTINNYTFRWCSNLKSLIIGRNVNSIGTSAFAGCSNLTSVTIESNAITSKKYTTSSNIANIFGSQVQEYILGYGISQLGEYAFHGCSGVKYIRYLRGTPPSGATSALDNICYAVAGGNYAPIYVPCGTLSIFRQSWWSRYSTRYAPIEYKVTCVVNSTEMGHVFSPYSECDDLIAEANEGYHFVQWNDGVTENPRHVNITKDTTFKAIFAMNEYVIKWENDDGTTLEVDSSVSHGTMPIYNGNTPSKSSTEKYTYTFVGWTPNVTTATNDTTYIAKFDSIINKYTIIWQNEDGSLIDQTTVEYGQIPAHADPVKKNTAEYTYTFAGWTPAVVAVTGNATYKATFSATKNKYLITFRNDDGTVLKSEEVEYGMLPIAPATPTKESTAQYNYEFAGWSPSVTLVSQAATYTATYNSSVREYLVTFLNDDNSIISMQSYKYGLYPTIPSTPTKQATTEYTYTFAGWTPDVVAVTSDATYKATFTATKNSYTITWQNEDGSLIDQTTVEYGVVPTHAEPTKQATAEFSYTFAGWTPSVMAVTGDAAYTATFTATKNSYTITWQNEDGSLIDQTTVEYGVVPTHAEPTKEATAEYTYTFAGWDPAIVAVTGDATYKATFSSVVDVYTISVSAVNGQVIGGGEYQYGATIDLTAIPNEGYVFDQWSDGVKDNPRTITVTGDAEYTALFTSTEGFENIYTSEPVQKVIIDQKVYILRGEKVYTLQGQEVK